MKAIAVATIHLGRKPAEMAQDGKTVIKPPVIEVIAAGQEFEADDKEVKSLIESGAARAAAKAEPAKADAKSA